MALCRFFGSNRRAMHSSISILAIFLVGQAAIAQELPETEHGDRPSQGFAWLGDLRGSCWVGVFPDETTEHRQCYTTQFGRFLRGTAALAESKEGAREVVFEGDSVFAWDEVSQRIVYFIWGSDGSYRQLEAYVVGDELHFPIPSRDDPARILYRSAWRRIDADAFEVRRERPQESGWVTELTVVYRRVAAEN